MIVHGGILTALVMAVLAGPTVEGLDPTAGKSSALTQDFEFNPCPSDSKQTTNANGDMECVCEPCSIPECQGNILPTILRDAPGVPGRCCPKYECRPVPGGRSLGPADEQKERCLLAGKSYKINAVWKDKDDPCKECRCEENGKVRCQTAMCRSNCAKPVTKDGECCPVCDEEGTGFFSTPNRDCPHPVPNETNCELVRTKRCKDGLIVDANGCIQCACKNGEVHLPPPVTVGKPDFELDDPRCSEGQRPREYCLDATTRCTCNFEGNGEAICTPVVRCEPSPHEGGSPKVEVPVPPTAGTEARDDSADALCKDRPGEYCLNSTTKCICDNGRANCTTTVCTSLHPIFEDVGHQWNSTLVAVIAVLAALCVILSVCLIRQCRHRRHTMSPHAVDIMGIPAPQRNLNLNLKSYFALPTT